MAKKRSRDQESGEASAQHVDKMDVDEEGSDFEVGLRFDAPRSEQG